MRNKIIGLMYLIITGTLSHSLGFDMTTIPALHGAAYEGDLKEVKFLLMFKDVDSRDHLNRTPLHLAIEGEQLEAVKYLLKRGADIEAVDMYSWASLLYSAKVGNISILKHLIDNGANIGGNVKAVSSPLRMATKKGHLDVVKILLESGAKVNRRGYRGFTALYEASNNIEITMLLLENGADVNSMSDRHTHNDGSIDYEETVLHRAIFHKNVEVVKALLENGADVTINHGDGRTTLEVAEHYENKEIIKFIKEFSE